MSTIEETGTVVSLPFYFPVRYLIDWKGCDILVRRKTAVSSRKNFPMICLLSKRHRSVCFSWLCMCQSVYRLQCLNFTNTFLKAAAKSQRAFTATLYSLILSSHRNVTANSHTATHALTRSFGCHSPLSNSKCAQNWVSSVRQHMPEHGDFYLAVLDSQIEPSIWNCTTQTF